MHSYIYRQVAFAFIELGDSNDSIELIRKTVLSRCSIREKESRETPMKHLLRTSNLREQIYKDIDATDQVSSKDWPPGLHCCLLTPLRTISVAQPERLS